MKVSIGSLLYPFMIFLALLSGFIPKGQWLSHAWDLRSECSTPAGVWLGRVERNLVSLNTGHSSFHIAQDTIVSLGCLHTSPGHVQIFIHWYSQALFCREELSAFINQSVLILLISPIIVLQEISTDPLLKPVRVPLDGIPSLMGWLGVFSKLDDGILNSTAYLIIKDIKPLPYGKCHMESPLPEGHHLLLISFGHRAIDYSSLDAAIHPIPNPSNSPPIKSIPL